MFTPVIDTLSHDLFLECVHSWWNSIGVCGPFASLAYVFFFVQEYIPWFIEGCIVATFACIVFIVLHARDSGARDRRLFQAAAAVVVQPPRPKSA